MYDVANLPQRCHNIVCVCWESTSKKIEKLWTAMDNNETFPWSDANVKNWEITLIWNELEKLLSRTMK